MGGGKGWEEGRGGTRGGRRREEDERGGVGDKGERRREKGKEGKRGEGRMVCYCEAVHVCISNSPSSLPPPFQPSDPPASPRSILKGGRIYEEERAVPHRYRQVSPQVYMYMLARKLSGDLGGEVGSIARWYVGCVVTVSCPDSSPKKWKEGLVF